MPKFSTKHKGREQTFSFDNFSDGYNEERSASLLSRKELSACRNLKYVLKPDDSGGKRVTLRKRQGTTRISATALSSEIQAVTYYKNQSQYIIAEVSKLHYLDNAGVPVEIGTIVDVPTFTEFNSKLIIHDGYTKTWDGTTYDRVNQLITDELLGTGDNIVTQFTGNLTGTVELSTISITFTDSTTKTITDDGAGNLIGNVDGGGTNTINYVTGAYDFTCDGAPDDTTLVEADYEIAEGAPNSKYGLVRKSSLYTWGDWVNPSRITYSSTNDETATDSSSGGGYIDIDPDDGDSITGVIAYQTSLLIAKENSLHRIDDYPGDATFKAEKLTDRLGCIAPKTFMFDGSLVSFVSNEGWVAMHPSDRYGDIQKGSSLSLPFKTNMAKYASDQTHSIYNPIDKQLWLAMV